jgi:hypothetical protein
MTIATRNITRLAKVGGRTDRAMLVLHHALTGKAGAGKATGFDRSSFGRNSKALQGWTRAQVNIAPGSADSSNVLVIASGKNNNFPEFAPYAIELDTLSMTYQVKEDFDMETWKTEIAGTTTTTRKSCSHHIAELLRIAGGEIEKKKLIEQARARTGRGENHIRQAIASMMGTIVEQRNVKRENKPAAVFIRLITTSTEVEGEE